MPPFKNNKKKQNTTCPGIIYKYNTFNTTNIKRVSRWRRLVKPRVDSNYNFVYDILLCRFVCFFLSFEKLCIAIEHRHELCICCVWLPCIDIDRDANCLMIWFEAVGKWFDRYTYGDHMLMLVIRWSFEKMGIHDSWFFYRIMGLHFLYDDIWVVVIFILNIWIKCLKIYETLNFKLAKI